MNGKVKVGYENEDRLDRAKRVEWLDIERISKSSALLIGAGALGNEVAKNLALSGVTELTIVDFDVVERSNLARCVFFTEMDALKGRGKAECLSAAVSSLVPGVRAKPIASRIEELDAGLFGGHDMVFGCLDNFNARIHANAHSRSRGIPYIDGGMQGMIGRVFVSRPPDGPCLECASNITHSKIAALRYSCTGSSVSFFVPPVPAEITTTSIVAALAVREGLRILSPKAPPLDGQMIYYDGSRNSMEILEVDVDGKCPNHSGAKTMGGMNEAT
jgi:molybdopterin/thiamine biosynthesis adenylyltransferase